MKTASAVLLGKGGIEWAGQTGLMMIPVVK